MRDTAHPRLARGGGKIAGRFEDAAMFDAIAAVLGAKTRPLTVRAKLPGSAPPLLAMLDV